jgi:transposase
MGKTFRPYDMSQQLLMPPDLRDWLPEGHLALFVSDVVDELNLRPIVQSYEQEDLRGRPPYHPMMMVKLLIYGYCIGKVSSRKIEQATYDDVAFRVLACEQHPDHDSIAEFRKRHLVEFGKLFVEVLMLCERVGLVKLGHVAVDGTKIRANASKYKTRRYWELRDEEQLLEAEVERLLTQAQQTDETEEKVFGKNKRGDELPPELTKRQARLAKIREAKQSLESEAKRKHDKVLKVYEEKMEQRRKAEAAGKKPKGSPPKEPDPKGSVPKETAKTNDTDIDSRLMKDSVTKSFLQSYNAQVAVDSNNHVIVAAMVVQAPVDQEQLVPVLNEVERLCGRKPEAASADAGYFSKAAVTDESLRGVDIYVRPNTREPESDPTIGLKRKPKATEQMWSKLKSEQGSKIYRARSTIVEPVFGYIKHTRGFRYFSFRGLEKVRCEWSLICMTHNLLKLFRAMGARFQPDEIKA